MNKKIVIIGNQGFSLLNFRGAFIEELISGGYKVYTLSPDTPKAITEALSKMGAEPREIMLSRTGTNPIKDILSTIIIIRHLLFLRPDVVISYTSKPIIYGNIAAWLVGIPRRFALIEGLGYVFTSRPRERRSRWLVRRLVEKLYGFALSKVDVAFFLNPDDINDFVSSGLIARESALMLGGIGVDLEEWAPAAPVISPVTFTFVGRLLKDKGVLEFVAAARAVKKTHPAKTRFVVVGGLDINPESISRVDVESWVSEGLIEWPGHVSVKPFLEQTSVFVLPSYREGVPRSTQEAMAMARPVITTDAVGCRETVVEGYNGYMVPVQDALSLATAMRSFIEHPESIAIMGLNSRKLAEERFDVVEVNKRLIRAMEL